MVSEKVESVDGFIHQYLEELRAQKIDGAPDDYWQQYADDQGPFVFPLYSAWITKDLAAPPSSTIMARNTALKMFMFVLATGYISTTVSGIFLLVALTGWVIGTRELFKIWKKDKQLKLGASSSATRMGEYYREISDDDVENVSEDGEFGLGLEYNE